MHIFTKTRINTHTIKVVPHKDNQPISWAEFLILVQTDDLFVMDMIDELRDMPFDAYFWEMPKINMDDKYEFVIVESPALQHITQDPTPFIKYMTSDPIVGFYNLGKDAFLLIPTDKGKSQNEYAHIANFIRTAPLDQIKLLFKNIGHIGVDLYNDGWKNLWISTCGLSVKWLHVRFDTNPKYYTYTPYK